VSPPDGLRGWLQRLGWSRPTERRALVLAGGGARWSVIGAPDGTILAKAGA